ncbi:MAG: hypothetical protein ACKO47_06390 [Alphaproteobacteria bacterium]
MLKKLKNKKNLIWFLAIVWFFKCQSLFAKETKFNLQTITQLGLSEGRAFGYKNNKLNLTNFSELPLTLNNSAGLNISALMINSKYRNLNTQYALSGIEFFHRYRFYRNNLLSLTVQNSYKPIMLYNENRYLGLMPKQQDYELRLLIAHNMTDRLVNNILQNKNNYFIRYELAYRRKFSNPFDELRNKLWLGIKINEKMSFLGQYDLVFNVRSKANDYDNSFKNPNNFQFSKNANSIANLSLVTKISNNLAINLNVFYRLSGNNPFFDKRGINFGVWQSF